MSTPFVLTWKFDAPRDLVWAAWTEEARLAAWFGPKGMSLPTCSLDLRPGGVLHYCMRGPDGNEMWGKMTYQEISAPDRLVTVTSFSDASQGITRHPMSDTWPLETRAVNTFMESGGQTVYTLEWSAQNATETEQATFDGAHEGMTAGWSGTMAQLESYLDEAQREVMNTRVLTVPRERVWQAFRDPQKLARWWGPAGFTNTFRECDFREGGAWEFTMHGPDGSDYQNECRFLELVEPERVVIEHTCAPHFRLIITLTERDGKTGLVWRQIFDTRETRDAVQAICGPANEQNLDRLEAVLAEG